MGLFDFIKNEFIEVIDWVDDSNNTVLYKFPDKGNKIMNGAQMTVRESQVVVLMNEGEFGDEYKPGRYELTTQNMPLTTTLKSWKYLFDSPFKVDVFFVNTKMFTNLKWGTTNPIIMRDPEFKQVRVRSFGTYTIKVKDAKKFIKEFSGTNPWVPIDAISEQCRNAITSKLAEGLAEAGVSVLDLAANFTEVANKLKPIFQTDFDAWGIELGQFYIENVSLPEEVEKMFDKTTSLNMMGDKLNQFNQMQAGISLEKMADNPGSGNMAGVNTGILLTNMMQGQLQQQPQQQQNAGNAAGSGNDHQKMIDLLKQLGELKAAGVITEEEFNQKKAEILGKL
jgi:membrane protease subunit (stomatin/prohibitin family)